MRIDERTRRYVARRTAEGKSRREIMRCLKRYIAREVYRVLVCAAYPDRGIDDVAFVDVTVVTWI
jgi:hypothetical protein